MTEEQLRAIWRQINNAAGSEEDPLITFAREIRREAQEDMRERAASFADYIGRNMLAAKIRALEPKR